MPRGSFGFCAGVVCAALAAAGGSQATTRTFIVEQHGFPPQLVVRTDRVEIGYKAKRGPNEGETATASGTLYVRNDLQRRFTAVPLAIRKGLQERGLWAVVPASLVGGHRLFYYGVIRDRLTGRTVTVPATGARVPESVWVVNDAPVTKLGAVTYGKARTPEAVVARAGPAQVHFGRDGLVYGPSSFDVTTGHAVWLFDSVKERLLAWTAGHPRTIAHAMAVPGGTEFALGPAGSVYLLWGHDGRGTHLTRLSAGGKVLWTSRIGVGGGGQLRTGPDGTLYWTGTMGDARAMSNWMPRWVPVATPAGRPLPLATQWARTQWSQPLPGGLQLVASSADWEPEPGFGPAPHEARLALVDETGSVVRAWRVTSRTIIWWYTNQTPALVGGDPVIVLTAHKPHAATHKLWYLVLRLGPKGEVRTRFTLTKGEPPRSAYGDEPSVITEIRVEPDGWLYQLGSAPGFGAAIYRYSLAPSA